VLHFASKFFTKFIPGEQKGSQDMERIYVLHGPLMKQIRGRKSRGMVFVTGLRKI
jgi:hypothetical protein